MCHQATAGILRVGIVRAMGLAKTMRKTMGGKVYNVALKIGSCKHFELTSNGWRLYFKERGFEQLL